MKRTLQTLLVFVIFLAATSVVAQDLCLAEAAGFSSGGNSCTANDISIKQILVGSVLDGCSNSSDTALVEMSMEVEVSGGGRKYDIAAFLNLQGGSAFSGTNQCFRDFFDPSVPEGLNEDGDMCNDANGSVGALWGATLGPIEIACSESGTLNGVVDFDGCVSYVQNADGIICNSVNDAVPLTTSKCGCSTQEIVGLALPELTLNKSCSSTELSDANPTSTCTITYSNLSTLSAADFHSFRDDYDQTKVSISNVNAPLGDVVTDDGDLLVWTIGGPPPAATANIVPLGSGTLTYDVTLLPNTVSTNDTVFNQVCSFWKDNVEPLCSSYTHNVGPTAAVISDFTVLELKDGVALGFRTASETGTLAFQLERWDPARSEFVPVGDLIPAVEMAPLGGDYQVNDPSGSVTAQYRVTEIERSGARRVHEVSQLRRLAQGEMAFEHTRGATRTVRASSFEPITQNGSSLVRVAARANGRNDQASRLVLGAQETGIQGVSANELAEHFGVSTREASRRLRAGQLSLLKNGAPVAWWTNSGSSELFFYAEVEDDPYSLEAVYWLDLANGSRSDSDRVEGAEAADVELFESTIVYEQNNLPVITIMEGGPDFWFWSILPRGGVTVLQVEVPDVNVQSGGLLQGEYGTFLADPGGNLSVSLNGSNLGTAPVAVDARGSFSFQVPPGLLVEGDNDVELSLDGQTIAVAVDTLSLTYQREFAGHQGSLDFGLEQGGNVRLTGFSSAQFQLLEISDPDQPVQLVARDRAPGSLTETPVQLAAGRYFGSDSVKSPSVRPYSLPEGYEVEAADFLIVTHDSLLDSAEAYADYRRNDGMSVAVWSTQQVFDHFTFSQPDPLAIRRLAEDVYARSASTLEGLFLIGNGTFDYRDLMGAGDGLVPSVLRDAGWGLVSSDRDLVDFDGDGVPDVPVGRLPVTSASQIDAYLLKVQTFEASGGLWRQRDLMIADNSDGAGDFPQDSQALAPYLRNPERVHLGDTHTLVAAREAVLDAWEQGVRLATYYGHGSGLRLAHENLFENSSLDALSSVASTPMLTALTCNIGRFDFPGTPGLGSQLVLNPKGSVAVWSAAGLSVQTRAREATVDFLQRLDQDTALSVGELVLAVSRDAGPDFERSLPSLLGDPLVTLE